MEIYEYSHEPRPTETDDRLKMPLEVLEAAVEGGWDMHYFVSDLKGENGSEARETAELFLGTGGFLLTRTFWDALGKALGWSGTQSFAIGGCEQRHPYVVGQALRYFESALTGADLDKFWTEVLSQRMHS